MCRVYGVTRAGFYAWRSRGLSPRAQENADLMQQITRIHQASRCLYGSPRIHHELKTSGVCVGENRVARLMRDNGSRLNRNVNRRQVKPDQPLLPKTY